ncbi:DUF1592 domain-containing protein [Roseiconus lacunae]|uniref:DUF1592 domain-containing protein n=1 Tax=Roseiconus lacunae TaxID=2605694 RepID=A0ABT7PNN3_9BACT|nr:DUF1592 domain-containing protein [Roseiconus lacunae]MDM4017884.1 DUF1592 domain-containing protein [Roseiconus lacunae]
MHQNDFAASSTNPNGGRLMTCVLVALAFAIIGVPSVWGEDPDNETVFRKTLLPLVRTYCLDCHDHGSEIDLAVDSTAASLSANRSRWNQAIAHLRLGSMPPEDGPEMDAETRARMVQTIDSLANAVNCVQNPNAGRVALRRLNRTEYRNTIRDLTGVDYKPADDFPGDDVGYGFDNIGDVLSLPPILMEKYVDAAMEISGEAIYAPPPPEIFDIQRTASALIGAEKYRGTAPLVMASAGTVALQVDLPFGGEFELTLTAGGDQGGDEPVKIEVNWGGKPKVIDVTSEDAEDITIPLRLGRGQRKIELSFINDFYQEGGVDRNFHLYHVKLSGAQRRKTYVDPEKLPASHRRILYVSPSRDVSELQAARAVLARFASRAFRRPVSKSEVERLVRLVSDVRQAGGLYEDAMQVAIASVLVSPHFLFKIERPRTPNDDGEMPSINNYELATRISYFLWSSMPDDELLSMAHQGTIRDRSRLLQKIASMIRDRRSNQFVDNFASQWLQLRNLETVDPDTRLYRGFDNEIRTLLWRETLTFFAGVMRENMPVTTLLDADFTYLNEPLAKFYGIPGVEGQDFRKVSLAGTPRGGLLTHGSVLTVTSNPTRTSPVKRGKWVLENLLNTPPPPAPADVPELPRGKLAGTLRERLEQHRANPACATCHNMMDPLGFALENFDAVGRWRSTDGVDEINASGVFPDGTAFNGIDDLRRLLSTHRKDDFIRALAEKLLIYAIGRGTEYYDKCAIDQIVSDCHAGGDRFAYLIVAIIESDPFQKQGYRE